MGWQRRRYVVREEGSGRVPGEFGRGGEQDGALVPPGMDSRDTAAVSTEPAYTEPPASQKMGMRRRPD
jgi:hypothetical protein